MNKFYFDKLVKEINKEGLDAMLICPSQELTFFAGFSPEMCERFQGLFVKADGNAFYICNLLYKGEVENAFKDDFPVYTWFDNDFMTERVTEILKEQGLCGKKIGVNSSAPAFNILDIAESADIKFVSGKLLLEMVRIHKTHEELENMRKAAEIADNAFNAVVPFIKAGMTELEVSQFLHKHMEAEGGYGCWSIVGSGPNSSYPHYSKYERTIQKGDPIVIDFGCVYNGLCSDTTRTVFVGNVTERQKAIWNYVNEANFAAEKAAKKGAICADIDKAARDVLAKYGYEETLTTRLGHGIGHMIHEQPEMKKSNRIALEKGMCFSIEPGIYLAGDIGVRIEDIVCINENGETEVLNKTSRELIIVDKD